jgi:hypothetical protein
LNLTKTFRRKQASAEADRNTRMDTEIGEILAAEETLIPSSGFTASVMERVRQEAALPPPIPFPWTWAALGILLVCGVSGWGAFEIFRSGATAFDMPALHSFALTLPQLPAAAVGPVEEVGWVALALGVSLVCWLFSRRLAGSGGLL